MSIDARRTRRPSQESQKFSGKPHDTSARDIDRVRGASLAQLAASTITNRSS
jgi:hypothetical protein